MLFGEEDSAGAVRGRSRSAGAAHVLRLEAGIGESAEDGDEGIIVAEGATEEGNEDRGGGRGCVEASGASR